MSESETPYICGIGVWMDEVCVQAARVQALETENQRLTDHIQKLEAINKEYDRAWIKDNE